MSQAENKPASDESSEILALRERLRKPFQGTLESLAESRGLTLREVVDCLPSDLQRSVPGHRFEDVIKHVSTWGDVMIIVVTADGVFECKAPICEGSLGSGYYNLGGASAFSGHIRSERCSIIYFIKRQFHKKETCSIQFFNEEGSCMFKIFVGRDADGELRSEQVKLFNELAGNQ